MGKLNQVIAAISGKKTKSTQTVTDCYQKMQKGELFSGISRTYQPKDEDGERLPSEAKTIQVLVQDLIDQAIAAWTEMFDVVATQDTANCTAAADVKIDGKAILSRVPVTHLLFLEKQLNDVTTFIRKIPILDPAEKWVYDEEADCYVTLPAETSRTKKVPRNHVKYEATKEHPAQVEMYYEDVVVGYWKTVKSSATLSTKQKNEMLERVRKLHEAVVQAREEANNTETINLKEGAVILKYIFGS
jgi:hypothetical protein